MDLKRVQHRICGQTIEIEIPADPEAVLSEAVRMEAEAGDADPYWCLIWAAAPLTASLILSAEWPDRRLTAIELGCGVGLAGIAAQMAGMDVTFSDYSAPAVEQAMKNARLNGVSEPQGLVLDWKRPATRQYDLIIGSDILYDRNNHFPVLNVLANMLRPAGEAWIGDMGRYALEGFVKLLTEHNWSVSIVDENGQSLERPVHQSFQLLRIKAPS